MKRLRTLLCVMLTYMLWMGIAAANPARQALAQGPDPFSNDGSVVGSVVEPESTAYDVWVGGKRVTSANAKNVLSNGKVSYNASTNTLTLKNAKIKGSHKGTDAEAGIAFFTNTSPTIIVKGTNSITIGGYSSYGSYGIYSGTGTLTIAGSGKLTTTGGRAGNYSAGIYVPRLALKGSVRVTSRGSTTTHQGYTQAGLPETGSFGIIAPNGISMSGSAQLVASGKLAAYWRAPSAKYGSGYSSLVKAGSNSKSISVSSTNPSSRVYTQYRYVKISNRSKKPAKMKITSVSLIDGGLKLRWKTLSSNCTGYQLQLSKSSSFPSGKSTWKYSTSNKSVSGATLTNLSESTRYYMRIRGINKAGSKTVYGPWSATKSAVTLGGAAG